MDEDTEANNMAEFGEYTRILQSRYQHLLSLVPDLDEVVEKLRLRSLLSQSEVAEIRKQLTRQDKKSHLCQSLSNRGITKLVDISQILKTEQARQARGTDPATSGVAGTKAGAMESMKTGSSPSERGGLGDARGMGVAPEDRPQQVISGTSREKPLGSAGLSSGPTVDEPRGTEDTFSILFYTFTSQLLPYLTHAETTPTLSLLSEDFLMPGSDPHGNISKVAPITVPSWLQVDVTPESASGYFPACVPRAVVPSERSPASMKLSLLLDSFQKLYHEFKLLKTNNQSLYERFDEVTKRNKNLEAELGRDRYHHDASLRSDLTTTDKLLDKNRYLESRIAEMEGAKRSYVRSEQRCKQLVVLTQQWAIECDEKVRLICIQEVELKELSGQVEAMDRRVAKYKKFWVENKDEPKAACGNDIQLRNELALRRELYDQVFSQKTDAQKRMMALSAELEALKVDNAQLSDRVANFKVQAQASEHSAREVSALLERNRNLEEEVDHMTKGKVELTDKILALELLVKDLDGKTQNFERHQAHHPQVILQQQPRKTQALVTGRNPLPTVHNTTFQFEQSSSHSHQQQQQQQPALQDQPISYLHPNYHRKEDDDDSFSLASSDGDFASYLSAHASTATAKRSGLANYSEKQNGSHDQLGDNTPLMSRGLDKAPPGEVKDYTRGVRYPNHSRVLIAPLLEEEMKKYANEDERNFQVSSQASPSREPLDLPGHQGGGDFGAKGDSVVVGGSGSPAYFDPSVLDPCKVPDQRSREDASRSDSGAPPSRQCLSCGHVFHGISEAEFEDHQAVCFT